MSLVIPDEVLEASGQTEQEARVEIACRMYHAEKWSKQVASRFAGLSRVQFEAALLECRTP